jgi:hypothetical protein
MTTDREMPPLPDPALTHDRNGGRLAVGDCFTADQMREYAIAYAAQEVEKVCALIMAFPHWLGDNAKRELCEAIRARGNT